LNKATHHGASIYLDISRLLSAGRRRTPSGIERVELAYVKRFGNSERVHFVAFFLGSLHCLPVYLALSYCGTLAQSWRSAGEISRLKALSKMIIIYSVLLVLAIWAWIVRREGSGDGHSVYLNLSHENLRERRKIMAFKSRHAAKLICFVHDLIPITHPEYVRPGHAGIHRRRMDTVAAVADVVLVNSAATREAFLRYVEHKPNVPEVYVVHLGITPDQPIGVRQSSVDTAALPYFVMLATVEPRKNHLLLLNLWRCLVRECAAPPRLIIVGRPGWENEMVLDMLERCEAIAGVVEQRHELSDEALGPLLRGARALLLPSFAEGFGLPVAEALAAGTPVICSDLPALREVGGNVPEYLDPMDGPAWRKAILDYAEATSPRRAAQCMRLGSWSAPDWNQHFEQVSIILEDMMRADAPG
jgi:glycosyltransferase involved in cell wall biosynthesis